MDGSPQKRPHFLVIGGMKCGSTTLYNDLATQASVFLAEKELDLLSAESFSVEEARRIYERTFANMRADQVGGDVSTTYAKLPDYPNVAERARQTLGSDLKIVYVVREPVRRLISQHYHMYAWRGAGHMSADIDTCVRQHSSLIDYSRYAMQLRPWRKHFGDAAIHVILFEEFVQDRRGTLQRLADFLEFTPEAAKVDCGAVANRGDGKPVLNRFWMHVNHHPVYQRTFRRMLPTSMRSQLRSWLLPKAPPRPLAPALATVESILSQVTEDELELRQLMGRDTPLWKFDEVRARYTSPRQPLAACSPPP